MKLKCTFHLNNQYMSCLCVDGLGSFAAWSGQGEGRNNPNMTHVPSIGALLNGRYYIVERPTGGRLGAIKDAYAKHIYGTDRSLWFGLYRDDGKIDDVTFTQGVKRGGFRLHPVGPRGISEGCITLFNPREFNVLRWRILNSPTFNIPGSNLRAYGEVRVI